MKVNLGDGERRAEVEVQWWMEREQALLQGGSPHIHLQSAISSNICLQSAINSNICLQGRGKEMSRKTKNLQAPILDNSIYTPTFNKELQALKNGTKKSEMKTKCISRQKCENTVTLKILFLKIIFLKNENILMFINYPPLKQRNCS